MGKLKYLSIGQWNVHGLKDKISNQDFMNEIKDFDVSFLSETWLKDKVKLNENDFYVDHVPATKKKNKQGRFSGGVTVLIKPNLSKIIRVLPDKKRNYGLWIKIDKSVLNSDKHLYIGAIYLPPVDSTYALKTPFENIEKDILELSENGSIILVGDFNARSSDLPDFICKYSSDEKIGLNELVVDVEPMKRFNFDMEKNCYGRKLVELCKNTNMLIANGRTCGDIPGNYTYHNNQGSSVVDYALFTNDLNDLITYFHVQAPNGWSDHCITNLCIKLPWFTKEITKDHSLLTPLPNIYKWSDSSSTAFVQAMSSEPISDDINSVLSEFYSLNEIDTDKLNENISNIYQKTARMSLQMKRRKKQNSKTKKKNYTFQQNMDYHKLKKQLKDLGFLFSKFPRDPFIRGKFFHLKKNFSSMLKKINKLYKDQIISKIQELEEKNPPAFWKLVNNLKQKKQDNVQIEPDVFHEYFKELHKGFKNDHLNIAYRDKIDKNISNIIGEKWVEILDKSISADELIQNVKELKNRKASSFDCITNEMIKCSITLMATTLLKLFNHVLHAEIFPKQWAEGYISPLYKKGDNLDPSNFRGITISSCIGKLFTRILNNRLNVFLTENNIISANQIGFISGKRTTDHIFVLKSLMDCAKHSKKHLYMCFVDLKSAFDTVWRNGLLYKLSKINASKKFINIVKNMYGKVQSCVKSNFGFTNFFPIDVGTRQGCNLSPALFNIYVNDLPSVLDKMYCNQPKLMDRKISCLLYADDLILLSYSSEGLQKLISATEAFCNKWQLTINVNKTKILIAHKRYSKMMNFKLYNKTIDVVEKFCYLGLELNSKGTFKDAIDRLYNKAFRAYMSLKENFSFNNGTPVKVLTKLYETMIQPILLYGCELWGIHGWRLNQVACIRNFMLSKNNKFEIFHNKFCKQSLGLNNQAPDILAKAELGRYPLMGNIIKHTYCYWQHILNSKSDTLLYKALETCIDMDKKGLVNYFSRIKGMLEILGVKNKIYMVDESEIKKEASDIQSRYYRIYEKHFFDILKDKENDKSAGKFELYCKTKKCYYKEKYLDYVDDNLLRRHLSSLRCGSNRMPINWLRKFNVDRDKRICSLCKDNKLGTELHMIFECSNTEINKHRSTFLKLIYVHSLQLNQLNKEQLLIYLVKCVEKELTHYFSIFLDRINKVIKRNSSVK